MRITSREIEWYDDFIRAIEEDYYIDETNDVMYRKLKALEDIEEDIGMSLLTLFRILKRGRIIHKYKPFCASKQIILESSIINGLFYESGQYGLEVYNEEDDIDEEYNDFKYVYIKDYGITWALTRKELENDK